MTAGEGGADALAELDDMLQRDAGVSTLVSPEDAARRRRRGRRGLIATGVVIALVLGGGAGYVGWALSLPLPSPTLQSQTPGIVPGPAAALALPSEGSAALSVEGAEAYLGTEASGVWAVSGSEEARPIASLSKLVTALVVLGAHPLSGPDDAGPTIRFSEADYDLYDEYYVTGATIAPMPRGSSMRLRDALETMLIPSASNYADAVASWAFGSEGAFVSAARRWLQDRGLTGTTIVEPTGISARNTSTPRDLMAIAKLAAADPTIAGIVSITTTNVPGAGRLVNTNLLLGQHGIDGLKTGNLGPGTYNLMFTASVGVGLDAPVRVTGVILGRGSREAVNDDVVRLLASIDDGFHEVSLIARGREVGSYSTPWGSSARIVVSDDASILTWSDTPITIEMDLQSPTAYTDGEIVGALTWTAGPTTETVSLEIEGDIAPPDEWWRLTHPGELLAAPK